MHGECTKHAWGVCWMSNPLFALGGFWRAGLILSARASTRSPQASAEHIAQSQRTVTAHHQDTRVTPTHLHPRWADLRRVGRQVVRSVHHRDGVRVNNGLATGAWRPKMAQNQMMYIVCTMVPISTDGPRVVLARYKSTRAPSQVKARALSRARVARGRALSRVNVRGQRSKSRRKSKQYPPRQSRCT